MWSEDVILESLRALVVVTLILFMIRAEQHDSRIKNLSGSYTIFIGFALLAFGSIIDITDNFPQLNHYIVIGDTAAEAFLEKVVGYLFGFVFLAIGVYRWLPSVIAQQSTMQAQLQQSAQEIETLQALLPICATCKKIRAENNQWQHVETYIRNHSESELTHGICPECLEKMKKEIETI